MTGGGIARRTPSAIDFMDDSGRIRRQGRDFPVYRRAPSEINFLYDIEYVAVEGSQRRQYVLTRIRLLLARLSISVGSTLARGIPTCTEMTRPGSTLFIHIPELVYR